MNTLKLSNVRAAKTSNDSQAEFIYQFGDNPVNYNTRMRTMKELYVTSNISESGIFHKNYLEYLETAWGNHLGIVITPDIVWYTLLAELTSLVAQDVEKYRHLFTDSTDKKEISVHKCAGVELPLHDIMDCLRLLVPTDVDIFLPQFSTATFKSDFARAAIFCDMVSPYYSYAMFSCGIPSVDVRGTLDDWELLRSSWDRVITLFGGGEWFHRVSKVLNDLVLNLRSKEWWTKILWLERCGSGSDTEVYGWWSELFREQPDLRKSSNYATHIANVNYKDLDTQDEYILRSGLFNSELQDGVLVPEFSHIVHLKVKKPFDVPYTSNIIL